MFYAFSTPVKYSVSVEEIILSLVWKFFVSGVEMFSFSYQ